MISVELQNIFELQQCKHCIQNNNKFWRIMYLYTKE